jgi:proline iminopeptidase
MEDSKFYKIRGLNIFVKVIGEGTPIIFLHGGPGGEHRFFLPHLEPLSKQYQLIFFDQRGCGLSEKASQLSYYSMEDEVETLEDLRILLGLDKINIVGESWGSMLALLYAVKYPERVNKILLTAAVGASVEGFKEFEKELFSRLTKEDKLLLDDMLPKLKTGQAEAKELFKIIDPYYVHSISTLARKTQTNSNAEVNGIMNEDIMTNYDLRAELYKLNHVPITIVQGEMDLITPQKLEGLLLNFLPNAKLNILEECGHWTVVEQPEKFMKIVKSFF